MILKWSTGVALFSLLHAVLASNSTGELNSTLESTLAPLPPPALPTALSQPIQNATHAVPEPTEPLATKIEENTTFIPEPTPPPRDDSLPAPSYTTTPPDVTPISPLPAEEEPIPESTPEIPSPSPADVEPSPATPTPEFLSFNEWREKYSALPETATKNGGNRRPKKGVVKPRHEGTTLEGGDGTELGSLFPSEVETYEPMDERSSVEGVVAELAHRVAPELAGPEEAAKTTQDSQFTDRYPLQPLANVGTGDELDPLVNLKDRTNYALFDCSAKVHRSSPQSKGASSILVEKKDRYMLTPCAANSKFVELELCEEIRIDTIVLANFEFFSSMFKHFSVKVSMHYPGKLDEWHDLGTFRARNSRGIQVFNTNRLDGWYRYMRIDFVSHYGSEYYCPVSLLRVFGITQMDKFRQEQDEEAATKAAEGLAIDENDGEEEDEKVEDDLEPASTASVHPTATDAVSKEVAVAIPTTETASMPSSILETVIPIASVTPSSSESVSTVASLHPVTATPVLSPLTADISTALPTVNTTESDLPMPSSTPSSIAESSSTIPDATPVPIAPTVEVSQITMSNESSIASSTTIEESPKVANVSATAQESSATPASSTTVTTSTSSTAIPSSSSTTSRTAAEPTASPARIVPRNETRPVVPPTPQNGDSIYGTIMKRLSGLEHNHTLAMHYIEAQSTMIRTAFVNFEQRLNEYSGSRQSQELAIRLALLDLERYRLDLDRDRLELSTKLNALTQEVLLERRLGVAQLLGLLALFVFVGLTRGSPAPFLPTRSRSGKDDLKRKVMVLEEQAALETEKRVERIESNGEAFRKAFVNTARYGTTPIAKGPARRNSASPRTLPRRHIVSMRSPRPSTPPNRHLALPSTSTDDAFFSINSRTGESKRARTLKASLDPFGPRSSALHQSHSTSPSDDFSDSLPLDSRSRSDDFHAQDSTTRWTEFESDSYLSVSDDEILAEPPTNQFRSSSELAPPHASLSRRPFSTPATPPVILPPSALPNPPPEPPSQPILIRKD